MRPLLPLLPPPREFHRSRGPGLRLAQAQPDGALCTWAVRTVRFRTLVLQVAPVQIIGCFAALALAIGPSFLAGVFCLCLTVPCQTAVLKRYFKHQMARLKNTDSRVKLANEMVQGIRVVKMYAWEQTIGAKVHEVRGKELGHVRQQRFLSAFLSVFMTTQAPP